jgi:rod shape-determining protein MreC
MLSSLRADIQLFGILVITSLLLFVLDLNHILDFPKKILQSVTIPIQYGLFQSSRNVSKQFEFMVRARYASQENKALTLQLAQVLSENANLKKQLEETQAMLEQQNSLDATTFDMIEARPLGLSRFLIIDRGSADGLKIGQTVIFKDNFIGQIKEISPKKSSVMLSTDPDSKVSAASSNKDGQARGILIGRFQSQMLLDKILQSEPIAKNDLIYSQGTEVEIPKGLIMGQVQETIVKDGEVFKQAIIKPMFDIGNLDLVFVITN